MPPIPAPMMAIEQGCFTDPIVDAEVMSIVSDSIQNSECQVGDVLDFTTGNVMQIRHARLVVDGYLTRGEWSSGCMRIDQ